MKPERLKKLHTMGARGCARQAEHHTDEAAKAHAEHYIKSEK